MNDNDIAELLHLASDGLAKHRVFVRAGFGSRKPKGKKFCAAEPFDFAGRQWIAVETTLDCACDQLLDATVHRLLTRSPGAAGRDGQVRPGAVAILISENGCNLDEKQRAYLSRYRKAVWRAFGVVFEWRNGKFGSEVPRPDEFDVEKESEAAAHREAWEAVFRACSHALDPLNSTPPYPPSIRGSLESEAHVAHRLTVALSPLGFKPRSVAEARSVGTPWCASRPCDGIWERNRYPKKVVLEVKHRDEALGSPLSQVFQYLAMADADLVLHVRIVNRDDDVDEAQSAKRARALVEASGVPVRYRTIRLRGLEAARAGLAEWIADVQRDPAREAVSADQVATRAAEIFGVIPDPAPQKPKKMEVPC